jgi:hypothetical protein
MQKRGNLRGIESHGRSYSHVVHSLRASRQGVVHKPDESVAVGDVVRRWWGEEQAIVGIEEFADPDGTGIFAIAYFDDGTGFALQRGGTTDIVEADEVPA